MIDFENLVISIVFALFGMVVCFLCLAVGWGAYCLFGEWGVITPIVGLYVGIRGYKYLCDGGKK